MRAQNAPLEWFSSTPGLGVMPRLLSEICWLCIRWSTFVIGSLQANVRCFLYSLDVIVKILHVIQMGSFETRSKRGFISKLFN